MTLDARLAPRLAALEAAARQRQRRVVDRDADALRVDGHAAVGFCSNDYLGLADHPALVQAFVRAAERYGVGSTGAHLVCGHSGAHQALEEALAEFVGRPRALLFSTGYMANLGVVVALAGRRDLVCEDRLNHASLLDAARLAGARLSRYAHADAGALTQRLAAAAPGALVATDAVFSMDGDLAPLPALAAATRAAQATLAVDDAHGIGVLGARGRGSLEHYALDGDDVPVLVGTLGKALGTFGAFVAGSEALIETLVQTARTYIYTTVPPPALAAATAAALQVVDAEAWRRERLCELVQRFRQGAAALALPVLPSITPIQPVLIGDSARALAASEALLERGWLVTAIRPPTVPAGSARLRVTLSARHTRQQVDALLEALADVLSQLAADVPA
jgi:8-amino-7-oxononanoate synthase